VPNAKTMMVVVVGVGSIALEDDGIVGYASFRETSA
jgi:hypothetical protein